VDLPIGHCEQSWEGGKSGLASPDTGLKAMVQEMLRVAHRKACRTSSSSSALCSDLSETIPLTVFPDY
jgi:hypothetical protein